ncbi:2-oxo acid dehydrogenase subunit E2 [Paenalcaligenes niemegkensis]|uniref:dihydrolipoamide acetyltransferase family protein n=1 Tax=Paenalcaligenes niemegkensis TaxID=2895469 RepID=UPI001EE8C382|nr:dihydrolipoamide acetyltransferase family protein [Paenalcaligenes niemegkensis]MCQ9616561.1 2-oxo acid dehydrogenase subunit E2 [Paenalcaligenes niemegkensis]
MHHELLKGVLASPAVRKRIADLGYKLSDIAHALGIERVAHGDLDRYLLEQQQGSAYDPKASARPGDTKNGSNETGQKAEAGIPLRGLRRQIAQKMQRSAHEIPHVSYVESLDVTDLEALRTQLNQKWAKKRGHLTLLPFLVRAISLAIKEHPRLNATFDSSTQLLTECSDVNMGIATQTNEGLMVPVLHQAQCLSAWEIAAAIRTLSESAKEGSLSRERATGSTITLSSLGSLGGIASTPIINHPEVAVIGVNKIVEQPVVREGQVVIRKMMNLSSSFDHRIIDGYDAAAFIQSVRRLIETPALMFIN